MRRHGQSYPLELFGDPETIRGAAMTRCCQNAEETSDGNRMAEIDLVAASVIFDVNILCHYGTKWIIYNRRIIETANVGIIIVSM